MNKNISNKFIGSIMILGAIGMISGCMSKEKKELLEKKENYAIVNTYDYDTTEGAIKDKKTAKELASDILKENVGISTDKIAYSPVGVSDENGIFVNSGIIDGDGIPEYPALTQTDIDSESKDELEDYFTKRKKDDYNSLIENREKALKENQNNLSNEEKLEKQLQDRIEQQKKDIKSGKVKSDDSDTTSSSK